MRPKFLSCAVLVFLSLTLSANAATVHEGVLDLRSVSLKNNSVSLNGFWKFYPNEFLDGYQSFPMDGTSLMNVPSWWDASEKTPPVHFGTYRIIILLSKEDLGLPLAIKMPDVYSSYHLWIDNKLVGSNGKAGTTMESSKPQWKPETYLIHPQKDTLEIIVHLSNFHHSRTGINNSVYFGDAEKLISNEQQTTLAGTVLFFSLLTFAAVSVAMFFTGKIKDKALVYYAALCIAWALRSVFSNDYLFVQWFPEVSWSLCVKVEYITLYLSTLFGSLLVGRLFPRDVNRAFRSIYVICCTLFTVLTIVTPPIIFTQFVQLYLALSSILLISILVIITKAYIEGRHGINYLGVCLVLAVVMFAYVILSYQGLFELNALLFNGGFFLLFLFSAIATGIRLNKMATTFDYDIMTLDEFKKRQDG